MSFHQQTFHKDTFHQKFPIITQRGQVRQTYANDMIEELKVSKIRGFPFFAYTGIKRIDIRDAGNSIVIKLPKNPNGLKSALVSYRLGEDTYDLSFYDDPKYDIRYNFLVRPDYTSLFVGSLGEIIVERMGVT